MPFNIGRRTIGSGLPTYIIAEIGINHNGDINLAKKMIDTAHECGVNCVKFQKRNLAEIYGEATLTNPHLKSISLGVYVPILKQCELTIDQHRDLKEYCELLGMEYLCTPFDTVSADEVNQLDVNAFKIGSVNMTDHKLIEKVASYGKPMIVSTGMSTWQDILDTDVLLSSLNCWYMFMHCVSTYPVDFKDINLAMISRLRELSGTVGYSGHERGIEISVCAVAMGASVIERHFTLDRTMRGPDHAASLEPEGMKRMVKHIRDFELARGNGVKRITRGEQIVREALTGKEPYAVGV